MRCKKHGKPKGMQQGIEFNVMQDKAKQGNARQTVSQAKGRQNTKQGKAGQDKESKPREGKAKGMAKQKS